MGKHVRLLVINPTITANASKGCPPFGIKSILDRAAKVVSIEKILALLIEAFLLIIWNLK